jgi:hypothetical protein
MSGLAGQSIIVKGKRQYLFNEVIINVSDLGKNEAMGHLI